MIDNFITAKKVLKPNEYGYTATDGTIYIGFYSNTSEAYNEYIYAMPKDLDEEKLFYKDAIEWINNSNDTCSFGHKDWDLPQGEKYGTHDELYLISRAVEQLGLNSILKLKQNFDAEYGGKAIHSYTDGGHIRYEDMFIWKCKPSAFNEQDKVNFRAVRRSRNLVI